MINKFALIGDVHANLPALEAVLAHARSQGVEAIWNVGDSVGYGAFPNEVVDLIRRECDLNILGNYDLKVLRFPEKQHHYKKKKRLEKFLAFQWAYNNLSEVNRCFLLSLTEKIHLQVLGRNILLVHASPASNEEMVTLATPDKRLVELVGMTAFECQNKSRNISEKADIIVFGHSHSPFTRYVAGVHFINVGTVGRPDDGDPRASYAIMSLDSDKITVEHFRVAYDVERAAIALKRAGLPDAFARMIQEGHDLNTILRKV